PSSDHSLRETLRGIASEAGPNPFEDLGRPTTEPDVLPGGVLAAIAEELDEELLPPNPQDRRKVHALPTSVEPTEAPASPDPTIAPVLSPKADDELHEAKEEIPNAPALQRHRRRREVAVALGEKKRFISVAMRLDGPDEDRSEALNLIANIAYKLEGLVNEQDREHIVTFFGLPTTDENDIVSAVRFSHDAIEAVAHLSLPSENLSEGHREHVFLRTGIRAGMARMGGDPAHDRYHILGNTVNEALALAQDAGEGQIYVAGASARLASAHYTLRPVEESSRRHGKPQRRHRIIGPRPATPHHPDTDAPLVGREIEARALRSAWREAMLAGTQRAVLIVGDAGLGKSRLADEFLLRHGQDARVLAATATPHRRDTPHALLRNILR
ncbi:MAG: AAA family ATPase, partial [Deltaproteobacteria bacterium]|nr:AAA family ATPase [Deltaproteobacteria bacterium]